MIWEPPYDSYFSNESVDFFFVKSADNGRGSGYGGTKITFLEFTNLAEMKFVKDKF